jgi:hypothetical protein
VATTVNNEALRIIYSETNQLRTVAGVVPVDNYTEIADCHTLFKSSGNPVLSRAEIWRKIRRNDGGGGRGD